MKRNPSQPGGRRNRRGLIIFAIAVSLAVLGAALGDLDSDLLIKAKIICLECIGIG